MKPSEEAIPQAIGSLLIDYQEMPLVAFRLYCTLGGSESSVSHSCVNIHSGLCLSSGYPKRHSVYASFLFNQPSISS